MTARLPVNRTAARAARLRLVLAGLHGLGQEYQGFQGEVCDMSAGPAAADCVQRNQARAAAALAAHAAAQNAVHRSNCQSNNAANPTVAQLNCDLMYPDVNPAAAAASQQATGDWAAAPGVFVAPGSGQAVRPPPVYGGPPLPRSEVYKPPLVQAAAPALPPATAVPAPASSPQSQMPAAQGPAAPGGGIQPSKPIELPAFAKGWLDSLRELPGWAWLAILGGGGLLLAQKGAR